MNVDYGALSAKEYEAMAEAEKDRRADYGKINVYVCRACRRVIVTEDRDAGVTPAFTACEHCQDIMESQFYKVYQELKPSHFWFRPSYAEYKNLSDDDRFAANITDTNFDPSLN